MPTQNDPRTAIRTISKPYGSIGISVGWIGSAGCTLTMRFYLLFAGERACCDIHDLHRSQKSNTPYILLWGRSSVATAIRTAIGRSGDADLMLSIPEEIDAELRAEFAVLQAGLKKSAEAVEVKKYHWAIGGDSGRVLIFADGLDSGEHDYRPDIEQTLEFAEKLSEAELLTVSSDIERDTAGLYLRGGWHEISAGGLRTLIISRAWSAALREKAEQEKRVEKFTLARGFGKPVKIESWTADCNDPREQCSTDIVTIYAMPDGTRKQTREHTW